MLNNFILSIDTGSTESGVVLCQTCCTGTIRRIIYHGKISNEEVIDKIKITRASVVLIEKMVAHGNAHQMTSVTDATTWEGRFIQECTHNPRIKRLHGISRQSATRGLDTGDKAIRAALIAKYGDMAKTLKTTDERAALAVAHRFTIATGGEREAWRL